MLTVSKKHSKKLAKLVLAALLCTGGAHGLCSPSVAEASELTVTGMTWSSGPTFYGPTFYPVADSLVYEGPYAYIPKDRNVTVLNLAAGEGDSWEESIDVVGHYSGYNSADNVSGYAVNVTGSNVDLYNVYGGYAYSGTAIGNTVTISAGTVDSVYGGISYQGDAAGNSAEIKGGTITGNGYYAIAVAGGWSYEGNANGNAVTISGGSVGTEDNFTDVVGGNAYKGNANDNRVTIEGNAEVYGNVYGGLTGNDGYSYYYFPAGDANNNTVTINDNAGEIELAYGGLAAGGNATGNTLNVSGGIVTAAIGGNAIPATIRGGYALRASIEKIDSDTGPSVSEGNATGNTVNISGDAQVFEVIGGATIPVHGGGISSPPKGTGVANNNTVNISGGTLGYRRTDEESGKTYIEGGIVVGGVSFSETSNNTINISGGDVEASVIIGGLAQPVRVAVSTSELDSEATASEVTGKADNNTVNILAPVNTGALFGGMIVGSDYGETFKFRSGSGNTLNVAAKDVSTFTVGGFQNMNFYLPSNIANGDTMLTIKTPKSEYETGEVSDVWVANKYNIPEDDSDWTDDEGNILLTPKPTDLTGVTFGVAAQQNVNLEVGNSVNLIVDENGLTTDDALKTADSATLAEAKFIADDPETYGVDDAYTFNIAKVDNNTIAATVTSKEKKVNVDERKSPAETREAVVSMVNMGADLIAGPGMQNAADAAAEENSSNGSATVSGAGGFAPFAAIGGSSLRAESGSHVDTKGIGLALGFARELKNSKGKLLIGPWVEYGHGKYDSYQDNGITADGKSHYWGVGVLAKQTNDNGLYYEGSLRVGRTGSDYSRNDGGGIADYDSKSTYWGAHLGIGKLVDIGHKNTLDYYGKYFYSHTGGDSVTIHTVTNDYRADFGSVNSHRLRVGARVTHELNEKNWIYGGLAYQYEFKGDARVTYNGDGSTPSPSMKGSSGLIELGWKVKPSKKSPMTIDVGVTGWVGKQRGITGNVQANWTF